MRICPASLGFFLGCMVSLGALANLSQGVGFHEETLISVPAETERVESSSFLLDATALLLKGGMGHWSLAVSNFLSRPLAQVKVAAGSLSISAEDRMVSTVVPPEVMQNAAFWVDAGTNITSFVSNGVQFVSTWYDVREKNGGEIYPRAVADLGPSGKYPEWQQVEGTNALFFGGSSRSGISMRWVNAAGSTVDIKNIWHVFLLHGVKSRFLTLLGGYASPPDFHVANPEYGDLKAGFWKRFSFEIQNVYRGRTYYDGAWIDLAVDSPEKGFHLLETVCAGPAHAANFFNDRNYYISNTNYPSIGQNRIGGDYLSEVVIFTNRISEAERLAVSSYLMRKWKIVSPFSASVHVAKEAAFVVDTEKDPLSDVALSGCGRVRKMGKEPLLFLADARDSFQGDVQVDEGSVFLGERIPLSLQTGRQYAVTDTRKGCLIAVATNASADTIVKTGDGEGVIRSVPKETKRLSIRGGTLVLGAPAWEVDSLPQLETTEVEIPNAGFEEWDDAHRASGVHNLFNGESYHGWTAVGSNPASGLPLVTFYNRKQAVLSGNQTWMCSALPPEGSSSLVLKEHVSAYTTIDVPYAGVYEISFWVNAREGYAGKYVDVMIGEDEASLMPMFGFLSSFNASGYKKLVYRTEPLRAGKMLLWFKSSTLQKDRLCLIDDLKMRFVAEEPVDQIPLPNGALERMDTSFPTVMTTNSVPGWSFSQGTNAPGTAYVGTISSSSLELYHVGSSCSGTRQLILTSGADGAYAKTASFLVPAGCYALCAEMGLWRYGGSDVKSEDFLSATVTMENGDEVALGEVSVTGLNMTLHKWPTLISLSQDTMIQIAFCSRFDATFRQLFCLMADRFSLRRVEKTTELIQDGGFEQGNSVWNVVTYPRINPETITSSDLKAYSLGPKNYGYARYEGNSRLCLVQNDLAYQEVTFPEAGWYQLSFFAHSRYDQGTGFENGDNPVRAWLARDGVTNEIGVARAFSTNFQQFAYSFQVHEPGTYQFALQGTSTNNTDYSLGRYDQSTLVDGVSIRSIPAEQRLAPELSESLSVEIAEGAQMRLDYQGAVRIDSFRIGSSSFAGEITAERFPNALSGSGALVVVPKGTLLLVR